ncbi:bleomycin hydrolase [Coemansia asiatica]|uniref:Bleomycin hydrolase n=1 Tax=Coemansia asiatica TaxID=1052880 RepID=A0A9W7XN78_9FUNG|nr:bleomycin hydrolase [Coemansia asiatica]
MLEEVHRIVTISLGQPPERFTWAFYDKDKKFHEFHDITPLEFYRNHVKQDCKQYVSLIHDPRNAYMKKYTPQYLGNVVGTKDVHYINLPINDFKRYAIETIKSGCPAWFGLHVEKFSMQKNDMVDLDVIDYKSAFNINFGLNKAEQMQYHDSHITHIVALTGVHIEDDKPVRWQIENSYGEDHGNKGYLTMTDKWFDEFAYVIVVDKNDLPSEILAVLDQDAIVLPPWNPMSRIK